VISVLFVVNPHSSFASPSLRPRPPPRNACRVTCIQTLLRAAWAGKTISLLVDMS
jgi:hypothetical protein